MKNILYYGDFGCSSGFANVSKELINRFQKQRDWNITIFAINNHKEEPYKYSKNVLVIPVNSQKDDDDKDLYGRLTLLRMLSDSKIHFDLLFCINDLEVINKLHPHFLEIAKDKQKKHRKMFKSMLYFPIDSVPVKEDLSVLNFFTRSFAYTKYAQKVIKDVSGLNLDYNYHGINSKDYYKTDARALKKKMFGKKFVYGTINRNSQRKDIATLMIAFAEIFRPNQDCLYLHCNPHDVFGLNLKRLAGRLGLKIGSDVFFPENFNENQGIALTQLNKIYNTLDVFVTTTTAEGFGLTVGEAMSSEILVIAPLHTSLTEVCNNGEGIIAIRDFEPIVYKQDDEKIRYKSKKQAVCEALLKARSLSKQKKADKIITAKNHIKTFTWFKTADTFIKSIKKIIG